MLPDVLTPPAGDGHAWDSYTTWTGDGGFNGEIDDPLPVQVEASGHLRVDQSEKTST